eukprot:5675422-Pyramimonas_sp.AAC.1
MSPAWRSPGRQIFLRQIVHVGGNPRDAPAERARCDFFLVCTCYPEPREYGQASRCGFHRPR